MFIYILLKKIYNLENNKDPVFFREQNPLATTEGWQKNKLLISIPSYKDKKANSYYLQKDFLE